MSATAPDRSELPQLLERESATERLRAALVDATSGSGRLVLVSGEAGVGKTALVGSFCDEQRGTTRVLWGTCDALFTPRPLGPLLDVAEALGGRLKEVLAGDARPHDVSVAVMDELKARPTILVLEDVHRADEATLDVLGLVSRRIQPTAALVVATYRDDELGPTHPLRIVLGELATLDAILRIGLEPLSRDAVVALAAPYNIDASELYRATAGNPFFATEVLAAADHGIPETIRDAVLARAARVTPAARKVLEAVAVVPREVELWLLGQLTRDDHDALDECLASGMLNAAPTGVAFRHELARIAVEASLTPTRRSHLHRLALATLEKPPAGCPDLARLAHHAEEAGDGGAVLRYAPAAAERAASLGAHREASAQYERALRFSDLLSLEAQAELYEGLSYESYLTGEFDAAIEACRQALERHRMLADTRRVGDSLRALSRLLWSVGRAPEASDLGREAVTLLESLPPGRELAMAYSHLATLSMTAEDAEGVVAWATRAAYLAQRLGDLEILALTRVSISATEYLAGTPGGRATLERELDLALEAKLEEVAARAFNLLVRVAMHWRDYAVVDRYLDAGFEYCREHDLGNFRQGLGAERARLLLDRGEWTLAADSANLVLSTARTAGLAPILALTVLGSVRARRGDPDVWAPLERAFELATPSGELQRLAPVATGRAEAAWLEGRNEAVVEATESAFALAEERNASWAIGELAYWRWRAGMLDVSPADAAEPYGLQINGEWAAAAAAWERLGCPYEAALAMADGENVDALRTALAELNRLGARPAAAIVTRRLRERGVRGITRGPGQATQANAAGLTARESEILGLLAEGLKNADIAQRLFLSPRTVEHHVSAILRKLGVTTRGEAVAAARREDLLKNR